MDQWILYVAKCKSDPERYCNGSLVCLRLIDSLSLDAAVTVQDADVLRQGTIPLPDWLVGTPTIVCTNTYRVLRGTDAIERIASIAQAAAQKAGRHQPSLPQADEGRRAVAGSSDGDTDADRGWPSAAREAERAGVGRDEKLEDALLADDEDARRSLSSPRGGGELGFGALVDQEVLDAAEDRKVTEADVKRFMDARGM